MLNPFKLNCFYLYLLAQTLAAAPAHSALQVSASALAPASTPIPIQTYRAQIPQTNQSCEVEAQAMAARFLAATKLAFVRGDCTEVYQTNTTNGKRTVYSIEISYPGEWAFHPASTVYGVGSLYWDTTGKFSGLYLDYDSCVADLAMRTAEYRQHTGLIPVAAFCERSSTTREADYVMQVDGFGKPQQTLYVFAPDRIEFPTDAAVVSDVKTLISRLGAQLVAEQDSRLFYYSEKSINLRGTSVAYFDNLKYCQEQLSEVQKIFTNKDSVPASVHCVATPDIPSEVELAVIYSGIDSPTSFDGKELYPSFEECRLDHDRALAREAREHSFVIGGLCHSEDGGYVMAIYQNRFAF